MRWLTIATFILGLGSRQPGAQAPSAPSRALNTTPELGLDASGTIEAALEKPLPDVYEVILGRGADATRHTVKNCTDYLTLGSGRRSTGSALNDASLRYLGATCVALDWLKMARPSTKPAFQNFSLQQITVRELPPELALAISFDSIADARSASKRGASILAIEPSVRLRPKSADEAELVASDWTAHLTVYGHADFFGDGSDELLVRWQGAATGGTYKATQVFLLARNKGRLAVVRSRNL